MTDLYETLQRTAETFIHSTELLPPATSLNEDAIRAICAEDYVQSWGHDYFISSRPHLNKPLDFDGFLAHLSTMVPKLESAKINITDMTIDERQRKVVVRAMYQMTPKGSEGFAENDIVWILGMSEDGAKVRSGKEFIDGDAVMLLRQMMIGANAGK